MNELSELDKAIACLRNGTFSASAKDWIRTLIDGYESSAKHSQELEKVWNSIAEQNKQLSQLRTAYKQSLVALNKCFTHLGHEIQKKSLNESASDGTQRLSREVAELLDKQLSNPLAIETMKNKS